MIAELWTDDLYQDLPLAWDHQVAQVPALLRGSYALVWEPRLGKTRACGEALRILDAERAVDAVLILPPVNAKDVWGHALDTFLPNWPQFSCSGLRSEPIPLESKAIICNPQILQPQVRAAELFRGWLGELLRWMNGKRVVLIEDESHLFFTNPMSPTYKAGASLSRVANRTWQLTGTPMEKSGLDLHWQFKQLGPAYPYHWSSRDQFGKRFCTAIKNPYRGITNKWGRPTGGFDYGMFKDPEAFWVAVSSVADRRLRSDCLDIPPTRRMDVWVGEKRQDLSPGNWAGAHAELLDEEVASTVLYVRRMLEEGEAPILVGGHSRAFTERVAAQLQAPLVRGGTPDRQRRDTYKRFQAGQIDVLVGNIRSMGTSIELTRAHHAVIGDLSLVARDLRQFEDRLQGINQTQDVYIHYLLHRHSVQELWWDMVLAKGRAIDDLDEAARRYRLIEELGAQWAEMEDKD